jgi:hypothetical protein
VNVPSTTGLARKLAREPSPIPCGAIPPHVLMQALAACFAHLPFTNKNFATGPSNGWLGGGESLVYERRG